MGSWGPALYSDDLAADLRGDFRDAAGEGLAAEAILDRLVQKYGSEVADPDAGPTFWLVVADMGWKLGRLDARARSAAMAVIESGGDLDRWQTGATRRKRAAVLDRLREQLLRPPPNPKRIGRRVAATTDWRVGEVFALRLRSARLTLLRVVVTRRKQGYAGRLTRTGVVSARGAHSGRSLFLPLEALDGMLVEYFGLE
jgi:hypothetical protein